MDSSYSTAGSLEQLANLRVEVQQVEAKIESVMGDAIIEAIDLVSDGQALNGKKMVYNNDAAKIYLVFRTKYLTPEEDTLLKRLDEDILNETLNIAERNAAKIQEIEAQIKELNDAIALLEEQKEKLQTSRYLKRLKKEFYQRREATSYVQPTLAVFVNKR